ncbi:glycoside hydrolase family 127 protein [Streptomyces sp. NBC_00365]|uniref:beta-L-arabinofuranosidase domain-containing protein n=1 Tax=Streptomyces sp. NBC_00365 TaxID=2975726 RepID=UPI0022570541|nr:beta-L-arabinofuranosidase domain-containing protein [Streptomyces sp. NBC_00365]MCX5088397.1 glycoside hydrolase family 127 protein [Streptomyces sp. NBC_00365]
MNPPLDRRRFLAVTGTSTAAVTLAAADGTAHASTGTITAGAPVTSTAPDTAARVKPFSLGSVTLLDSAFRANQRRNSAYLRFVDIDRLLHTFRTNVGLPSTAQPCGGWEGPSVELRGHSTGHLLSGLALAYGDTGERALRDKGRRLVAALAECEDASPAAGYLSAFPESFFDRLEAGTGVWAPYYTIHKIMAGLVEQHRLTGSAQALDVVLRQAEWVDRRTEPLSYERMQRVLETEFGGMNDVTTGSGRAAQLAGGATWTAAGVSGGAVALDGTDGHVHLADDLLAGAAAYTPATWVRLDGRPGVWSRVFDLGTGVTANMFLTPLSGDGTLRYAITAGGAGAEQRIDAAPLPTDRWVHVAVAYGGGTAVLYVDGQEAGRNTQVTVEPRYFGNHIRAGYLSRSQYADPYLRGAVDDFRVYGRTLTAEEVAALAQA